MVLAESIQHFPLFVGAFALAAALAFLQVLGGKRFRAFSPWSAILGMALLLVAACFEWHGMWVGGMAAFVEVARWWQSSQSHNEVQFGFFIDPLGILFVTFLSLVTFLFLAMSEYRKSAPVSPLTSAATVISVVGVLGVWISATIWMAYLGLGIFLIGQVFWGVSQSSKNIEESHFFERSIREIFLAMTLMVSGSAIAFDSSGYQRLDVYKVEVVTHALVWGKALFLAGIFVGFRPFPFLGWIRKLPPGALLQRSFIFQHLQGALFLGFLVRTLPAIEAVGLRQVGALIAVSLSLFSFTIGLFQRSVVKSFVAWISGGYLLVLFMLFSTGPRQAFLYFTGVLLASLILSRVVSEKEQPGETKVSATPIRFIVILGSILGSGGVCFVGTAPLMELFQSLQAVSVELVLLAFGFFLSVWLVWKVGIQALERSALNTWTKGAYVIVALWFLLGLAVLWTGSLSGGLLWGDFDRVGSAWILSYFAGATESFLDHPRFIRATGYYATCLILGIGVAYGLRHRWTILMARFPRFWAWGEKVLRLDELGQNGLRLLVQGAYSIEYWLAEKLIHFAAPALVLKAVVSMSRGIKLSDIGFLKAIDASARKSIQFGSRTLQAVQNGDVQWYVLMATASILVLLGYYCALL